MSKSPKPPFFKRLSGIAAELHFCDSLKRLFGISAGLQPCDHPSQKKGALAPGLSTRLEQAIEETPPSLACLLRYCITLVLLGNISLSYAQTHPNPAAKQEKAWVFAYFKEPGTQGIYLALSHDGYTFTPLNDGQPWVKPTQQGEIMRDVFITREPGNQGFRMVWTWGWRGHSLGTASSEDLMTWTPQQEVPIMQDFPTVRQVWAPETYWDAKAKQWLVIWSSSFSDTNAEKPDGLRIWAARTNDFKTFTKPAVFFDRGFPVIDATMYHGRDKWFFVFKDQTTDPLRYTVRWTSGPTVEGPWGDLSGPIAEPWSEGPSVVHAGDKYIVYYDHYRAPRPRYEGVETTDWIHWTSVNDKMSFPQACKHGSFFPITEEEEQRLLSRHDGIVSGE